MFTTFQGFLARMLIHASDTEGNEENLPDDTKEENLPAAETQEQTIDSEHDETDGSDATVTPNENQQNSEQTTETDSQSTAAVERDAESHSSNVDDETVTEAEQSMSGSTEGVVTTPDEVVVDVLTVEPVEETVTVNTAEAGTIEGEATEAIEDTRVPLTFGVIDEVYNFVDEFQRSQSSDAEKTSASTQDSAGGIKKAALFEHPPAEGYTRIQYEIKLPQVKSNENLILHFSIGLRDGVEFELPHTKPDGVQFAIEISDERRFEGASAACRWDEHLIDLSDCAGKTIQVDFLTNCNGAGNTNYDWALWGNPRVLKLTRTSLLVEKGEDEPRLRRGLALGLLKGETPELSVTEFDLEISALASEVAEALTQQMEVQAETAIVELALYTEQPKLEIITAGPAAALLTAREDFDLQCTVRNNGLVPIEPIHEVSVAINRIKLRRGRATQPLKRLNPGEEITYSWNIRSFSREAMARALVVLRYQSPTGEIRQAVERSVIILSAIPRISSQTTSDLCTYDQSGHVITENRHLRTLFVRGASGFEYCLFFAAKNGRYRQAAVCNAISEIRYRDSSGKPQHIKITPTVYRLAGNNRGESIVLLSSEERGRDGVLWSYEARFSLAEESKRLKVEYSLTADQERELIAFNGPTLYAGDGAFGERKTAALFPGLEFLEDDEPSSSPRDVAPPNNNRLVPHPYKITIPLMAVEHKRTLVGLAWDALETWDGEHNMLSAAFASPNWHNHQKNHLMGLFVPTIPDWVEENHLAASTPYPLKANLPITIKAQIIIDGNASILDAISHWTDAYGVPEPLEAPRSDREEVLLSRHGFMQTVWDKDTSKSQHCVDWTPSNAPGFATLLWYDYLIQTQDDTIKDESVRQRALEIVERTIQEAGPGGLSSTDLCHILKWEAPFYFGEVEAGLDRLKEIATRWIETQEAEGSWGFHPITDRAKTLGDEGDAVLGTCASTVQMLLKHARVTGDVESLEAGVKGLKYMENFKIPRGAQTWECPLYEPDLLAAAHAVSAYVEAYEITKEKRYLERAERWAKAGLPFVYHWHLPGRPGMRFGSIPVFGTTFYTHPWFGVPVQWNGLVYAYALQHLARHTSEGQSQLWSKVAEGITISAMYQQWTEGGLKGTYPDGFYGHCTEGRGPHINPEDIMVNLYTLRGLDPDISTRIVRVRDNRIHVSSGARVDGLDYGDSDRLTFALRYVQNETSYCIIAGYGGRFGETESSAKLGPSAIRTGGEALPLVDSLSTTESGWLYREDKDIIFIKYKHQTGATDFEVLPSERVEPAQETVETETAPENGTGDTDPSEPNSG